MVLNKRIGRIFITNKSKYIGSILLVALSCMLFTAFSVAIQNLSGNEAKFLSYSKLEDANTVLQKPMTNVQELENKYSVSIESRKTFDLQINDNTMRVFNESFKIDKPYISEGRDIKYNNDILIDSSYAKARDKKLGDKILIYGKTFKVCGFFSIPDYLFKLKTDSDIVPNTNTFCLAVISKSAMASFNKGTTYYLIKGDKTNIKKLKDNFIDNNKIILWQDIKDNNRYSLADAKIKGVKEIAVKMPIAILILTSAMLSNIMWRMLKTEFIQIGTLYALGYKKREILIHYLIFPLVLCISGSIIGNLLGLLLEKAYYSALELQFNVPNILQPLYIKYMIISMLIPIFFIIPAVYIVLNRVLRCSPMQLMRGNISNKNVGFIERKIKLEKFKFNTKFAIREFLRSVSRTLLMIAGVALAALFILTEFGAINSFDNLLSKSFKATNKYEYNYLFNSIQTQKKYDGEVYSVSSFSSDNSNVNFSIFGIQPDSKLITLKDSNDNAINLNKIVITEPLARSLNVKVGDYIEVTSKIQDKKHKIRIDKIARMYTAKAIYMPLDKYNEMLGLSKESFLGVFSNTKLNIHKNNLLKYESSEDSINNLNTMLAPIKYSVLAAGTIATLIALIVIYIITSLTVEENRNSISLFKVLGYKERDISSLLLGTGIYLVIIGYLISIPIMKLMLGGLLDEVTKNMNLSIPVVISPIFIAVGFIIVLVCYEFSKFLSKRKILSISMAESLKIQRE